MQFLGSANFLINSLEVCKHYLSCEDINKSHFLICFNVCDYLTKKNKVKVVNRNGALRHTLDEDEML